jgi:hypothetical protein
MWTVRSLFTAYFIAAHAGHSGGFILSGSKKQFEKEWEDKVEWVVRLFQVLSANRTDHHVDRLSLSPRIDIDTFLN